MLSSAASYDWSSGLPDHADAPAAGAGAGVGDGDGGSGSGSSTDRDGLSPWCSGEAIMSSLNALRERRPLVHSITNLVVQNTTANALLAIGASPAMVVCVHEVEEFAAASQAVVINLGTVVGDWPAAMRLATRQASAVGVPWVLDPVGVGAIGFRSRLAVELLRNRPAAIRGNATEIIALSASVTGDTAPGTGAQGKGVDSLHGSEAAIDAARWLAAQVQTVVAVTGEVDYVTDGTHTLAIHNGHPMMPLVTGLGCTATALVAAFLAVAEAHPGAAGQASGRTPLIATAHALTIFGVAGEVAAAKSAGPGTLQMHLYDVLYAMGLETLQDRGRLSVL